MLDPVYTTKNQVKVYVMIKKNKNDLRYMPMNIFENKSIKVTP